MAKTLGSHGGQKSVQSRFKGKSKEEISAMMSEVRKTKFTSGQTLVDGLNHAVLEEQNRLKR